MKNEIVTTPATDATPATDTAPAAKVPSQPAVSAEGLHVSFVVSVNRGEGRNAFNVEGAFDLPSALHPARRFQAEEDFENFLNRSVVTSAKTMLG